MNGTGYINNVGYKQQVFSNLSIERLLAYDRYSSQKEDVVNRKCRLSIRKAWENLEMSRNRPKHTASQHPPSE